MSEKAEALIGLIDGYLAKKNNLPVNAIKEELKRVKVLEDLFKFIEKAKFETATSDDFTECVERAIKQALGEANV